MTSQNALAPQYSSDDEIVEHPETVQNVRAKPKTWILVQTFEDKLSAT